MTGDHDLQAHTGRRRWWLPVMAALLTWSCPVPGWTTEENRTRETPWAWNPLTWHWTPSEDELLTYRRSWNPLSNGPILSTSVDLDPAGQFHMQAFGFGEIAHQQFGNTLSAQRRDSPLHLQAFQPLVVAGYGLTDHVEVNVAFTGLYWNASPGAGQPGPGTSDTGLGDTALYVKYRPIVQDPEGWRPSITIYNQLGLPSSQWFGTQEIPGGFSPLGKLPETRFGSLSWTEGVLFRKNMQPFRVSGGVYYTYSVPGNSAGLNTYVGDIVNTRLVFEHLLDDRRGFGYNIEFISLHGLPFRADGHPVTIPPTSFQLFGVEPAIQFRLGEHWVGAAGVLFTIAGQNNLDAIYPNFSFYYYWGKGGGATMR